MSDIKFPVHTTIFHADWEPIFADRSYGECWELIMAMFGFMENGEEPNFKNRSMQIAWRAICERMKKDIARYQQKVNGEQGGLPERSITLNSWGRDYQHTT